MVIVDTCVFVDFFRGKVLPRLVTLIEQDEVLLSGFVRLELLAGVRKAERAVLENVLGGLVPVPYSTSLLGTAEDLLAKLKGKGVNAGTVDLLIAAEAREQGCALYSSDRIFAKLAELRLIQLLES